MFALPCPRVRDSVLAVALDVVVLVTLAVLRRRAVAERVYDRVTSSARVMLKSTIHRESIVYR